MIKVSGKDFIICKALLFQIPVDDIDLYDESGFHSVVEFLNQGDYLSFLDKDELDSQSRRSNTY